MWVAKALGEEAKAGSPAGELQYLQELGGADGRSLRSAEDCHGSCVKEEKCVR